ncbi:chromosome partitioning protein ParA [Bacillus sp. AFS073361]|uniref:ParA family protein n=1 Tax=Bacillus sp. AFS073361 TaxID=2033511 RepID=UPI000BF7B0C9|nr:ParA family protein [Bacillus sp. AFS073361]PFP29356.1 chromosome partitioning protein ParA [Bacillus sp. AFS073361]
MGAKVLACSTNKGGVLKTSVTVNLAGVWASQGKKVLIIDCDNQGNSILSFGHNPDKFENTIYDVLVDGLAAEVARVNVYKNIDVIPANDDMTFFEMDVLTNKGIRELDRFLLLKKAVNHLKSDYDIILVDSPPTLALTQANILSFVDYVVIPFQPEPYSMRSLVKIVQSINTLKLDTNPNIEILGILGTLVDSRANLHTKILQECRQLCEQKGWKLFDTVITRSVRYADEIKEQGLPATLSFPKHPTVKKYFELAKEIEEAWQEKKVEA